MAVAVAGAGALLALTDADSPLRGPFTLFFLLLAPGAALGAALRGLEPFGRVVVSLAGAVAIDFLVAQAMLATHSWSVRGGITAVTVDQLAHPPAGSATAPARPYRPYERRGTL